MTPAALRQIRCIAVAAGASSWPFGPFPGGSRLIVLFFSLTKSKRGVAYYDKHRYTKNIAQEARTAITALS